MSASVRARLASPILSAAARAERKGRLMESMTAHRRSFFPGRPGYRSRLAKPAAAATQTRARYAIDQGQRSGLAS
jgi:hypothetical protein